MAIIKTPEEIAKMREGGTILAHILHELALTVKIGMTTESLAQKTDALMGHYNVMPSFKGYHGYPSSVCVSVNEEIVHGIPGKRILQDGDVVKLDCGVFHKGLHTDSAVAVMLGNVPDGVRDFVYTSQKAFEKALSVLKQGNKIGDIGFTIQNYVESRGYSIVRDYTGHGVGRNLHEQPEITNFGKKGTGALIVPGMTLAIEPIIAMGARFSKVLPDKWTAITKDGSVACQVEHSIAITPSGYDILTMYDNNINCIYSQ